MKITSRWYRHDEDFEPVMNYLRETYRRAGRLENWPPTRFENSDLEMKLGTRIWENTERRGNRIVALATPEGHRYFLQMHPDHNLGGEVLSWVDQRSFEQMLGDRLSVVVLEGNTIIEDALRRRGYEQGKIYGIQRLRDPAATIPECMPPDGFKIRSVESKDFDEIAKAIRVVFGHGVWFTGNVLENASAASFYHRDLDLVATDPSGAISSFCTFRLDYPSGIVELEPIGTLPKSRGRGLAEALLCEGFRRLKGYDVKILCIDGAADNPAANRLYERTGFTTRRDYYYWSKGPYSRPI